MYSGTWFIYALPLLLCGRQFWSAIMSSLRKTVLVSSYSGQPCVRQVSSPVLSLKNCVLATLLLFPTRHNTVQIHWLSSGMQRPEHSL